jgi:hypothetical protein
MRDPFGLQYGPSGGIPLGAPNPQCFDCHGKPNYKDKAGYDACIKDAEDDYDFDVALAKTNYQAVQSIIDQFVADQYQKCEDATSKDSLFYEAAVFYCKKKVAVAAGSHRTAALTTYYAIRVLALNRRTKKYILCAGNFPCS